MRAPSYDYRHVMIALDNSKHSNRAIELALSVVKSFGAELTGTHAYAAKLHDLRFRQMEGGLPEQYRKEDELERQRDVHDTLITKGLQVITDSYLDVLEERAGKFSITPQRKSLEGKNYRALLDDILASDYDLVVLGALGLGAVEGSVLGSVCERIVRQVDRDVLVAKNPNLALGDGPIVVAVDGSAQAFAGLKTALRLAAGAGAEVEIVSAFDPYFHYVAFHSIADVLSDEAGKVFKFEEQEKLHEDIIDSGLAKIYQGHLAIAEKIATEAGVEVTTKLLAGKPYRVIAKHVRERKPSLLVIGRTGVHADDGLDIGSNAENLLRMVDCHVLLTAREFEPPIEDIAEETMSWTEEAEKQMERVPGFVRNMARKAIIRYAQEQGHTVVSSKIVDEAVADLLPASAMEAMGMIAKAAEKRERQQAADAAAPGWTPEGEAALGDIADPNLRHNVKLRAEKVARVQKAPAIDAAIVRELAGDDAEAALSWTADAMARMERVPGGFMRDKARERVELYVRGQRRAEVTLELCEAGLAEARKSMMSMMGGHGAAAAPASPEPPAASTHEWSDEAQARLEQVPAGFMRDLTRQRVETFADRIGASKVTVEVMERKYAEWGEGSARVALELPWEDTAVERVARIPDFVRGMVMKEVERCAREQGVAVVTEAVLTQAMSAWAKHGVFHSESNAEQYSEDGPPHPIPSPRRGEGIKGRGES